VTAAHEDPPDGEGDLAARYEVEERSGRIVIADVWLRGA
jgi:hypothetical protein